MPALPGHNTQLQAAPDCSVLRIARLASNGTEQSAHHRPLGSIAVIDPSRANTQSFRGADSPSNSTNCGCATANAFKFIFQFSKAVADAGSVWIVGESARVGIVVLSDGCGAEL
jgi:hypothetical protein